jgi:hypothetical protein
LLIWRHQIKHQVSYHLKASTTYIPTKTPSVPLNVLFTYLHSVPFTGDCIGSRYGDKQKLWRLYW